jgi:HEAT repeat protein
MGRKLLYSLVWVSLVAVIPSLAGCGARTPAEEAAAQLPALIKQLKDPDPDLRAKASDQIRGLGIPYTKEAIPHLLANFEDENEKVREWAAQGIAFYGEDAIPGVMEAARSDSPRRRAMAFVAIGGFAGDVKAKIADEAVPLLAKGLQDEDPKVRRIAASALRFHGSLAKSTVALQAKVLETEQDKYVLGYLLKGLGTMGPDAKEALPAIEKFLTSPDPQIIELAHRAKFFIEGGDEMQLK